VRPTPRFFGALALAAAVFYYGGSSNVAWLYLLAYWIAALVVTAWFYARWNRGLRGALKVHSSDRGEGSPMEHLPERILAAGAAWTASKSDAVARRARLRKATMNLVVRHPSRLPAALAAEQVRGAGKPGFMQALQAILEYDFRERLPEIACPTLIVWGERDRLINVRDADVFAELIGNSRKVVFEDTAHMAMLERPAAFNALLKEFLSE